ncbi:MAG: hypothetical protein IJP03_01845, partial [Christensenellaceae bacterium]|nr:hypothetical protein [Christensenellaceae bacterium]
APPADLLVTAKGSRAEVRFSSLAGAVYRITRQPAEGEEQELCRIAGTGGIIRYVDRTLQPGRAYLYRVTPLYSDGQAAAFSAEYLLSP